MDFLHDGLPRMHLTARWNTPVKKGADAGPLQRSNLRDDLVAMVKRLNICSKEYVVRQYDHEVQGGSVVKPLCGAKNDGPSDAAVFRPVLDSQTGLVVSNGIVPRYSDIDTYAMVCAAVDEAVRNAVCVGADPDYMAGLDNFCWCDPVQGADNPDGEYKLAQLVRANLALYDLCISYGIPLISGKDSMKNDYRIGTTKISIPPTILFSLVGRINDVSKAVTMDFKAPGNAVYLLGTTYPELGASEYAAFKNYMSSSVPTVHNAAGAFAGYRALHGAIQKGLAAACHDCSDGGLAVALAEMCLAGELGASIDCSAVPQEGCRSDAELLFSESQCRIVIEVYKGKSAEFEALFPGMPLRRIGTVSKGEAVDIKGLNGLPALSVSRIDLKTAWKSTLNF
jgi:phosphoribosylformylglycinamidine synthase